MPWPSRIGAMCRSISSISPCSRSWRPMVGENTSRFLPPAALQPDPHRLCRAAVEERDIVGGPCVLGVVGENEDRPVPGAAVRASIIEDVPAVASTQHGASGLDVLL